MRWVVGKVKPERKDWCQKEDQKAVRLRGREPEMEG